MCCQNISHVVLLSSVSSEKGEACQIQSWVNICQLVKIKPVLGRSKVIQSGGWKIALWRNFHSHRRSNYCDVFDLKVYWSAHWQCLCLWTWFVCSHCTQSNPKEKGDFVENQTKPAAWPGQLSLSKWISCETFVCHCHQRFNFRGQIRFISSRM